MRVIRTVFTLIQTALAHLLELDAEMEKDSKTTIRCINFRMSQFKLNNKATFRDHKTRILTLVNNLDHFDLRNSSIYLARQLQIWHKHNLMTALLAKTSRQKLRRILAQIMPVIARNKKVRIKTEEKVPLDLQLRDGRRNVTSSFFQKSMRSSCRGFRDTDDPPC